MRPQIGLYVSDNTSNKYHILDERKAIANTGNAVEYQVECTEGPNLGKIRWIGMGTIVNGDFPVSKE